MSPGASEPPYGFFDQVVSATGIAELIAAAAVSRACVRAGVVPAALTPESLVKVLPHLEKTLEIYLHDEAELRLRAIRALARPRSVPPKV